MTQFALNQSNFDLPLFPDHSSYIDHCLELAISKLKGYDSIPELENDLPVINRYKHFKTLEQPRNIIRIDKGTLKNGDHIKAWKCIMDGKLFTEHFAAGEATRLGLGTKYLINIQKELPFNKITELISREKGTRILEHDVKMQTCCNPSDLFPISLGVRHMLQLSYDIYGLSKALGYDPKEVLSKQKMLIILNEATADTIIEGFIKHGFYGFMGHNVLFMIQASYHGINLKDHQVFYDRHAPKKLHNHGHIAIQQTMNNQIFFITENKGKNYLTGEQFGDLLNRMEMKISYNIEDLDYLTGSMDYEGLALAIKKNKQGYNMLMEVVPNNPDAPQKGGMAAFDPILGHDVIIESFQLNGIENHEIKFLNKNVNFYPEPCIVRNMVKKNGLNMHIAVKDGFIYFQPVLGDINFLVKTAIFTRKYPRPIKAWKSADTTPLAVNQMHMQDIQKGFKEYAQQFLSVEK